jgi:hypothetical protein
LSSHRVARYLERQGILQRDKESSYLQLDGIDDDPMQPLIGCSVSYRIAVGPQQGRKVFTLQTSYRDGTTHVMFEPLDFISKLASLVPKTEVNLTQIHGVFVGMPHHPTVSTG